MQQSVADKAVRDIAQNLGATVAVSERGNLVITSAAIPTTQLDITCVYPVVDKKTGGHTYTYATWLSDLSRTKHLRPINGNVVLAVVLTATAERKTKIDFWSNCVSDSELGRLPSESKGLFEKIFIDALLNKAGQRTESAVVDRISADAPGTVDFHPVTELPSGSHRDLLRSLLPGVSDRTRVTRLFRSDIESVWSAAVAAASDFGQKTGSQVVRMDRELQQIWNGDATQRLAGRDGWADEILTTIARSGNQTRVTVTRRLQVQSEDEYWKGVPSDGEVERFLITDIERRLGATEFPAKNPEPRVDPGNSPQEKLACTVDQILKMKDAGLTNAQIDAACRAK